jgi:hypothetical protein
LVGKQREEREDIDKRWSRFDNESPSFLFLDTKKVDWTPEEVIFLNQKHVNPVVQKKLRWSSTHIFQDLYPLQDALGPATGSTSFIKPDASLINVTGKE